MTFKYYKKVAEEVEACKNDSELLDILQKYPKVLHVKLDNDNSCVCFQYIDNEDLFEKIEEELNLFIDFQDWHGNDDGVFLLFERLGITAEGA
jgi:hypothetical protein